MLQLYSQLFDTIEVDSTAYGTPAASTIEGWIAATSENFRFSLKTPSLVTHQYSLAPEGYDLFDEFVEAAKSFGTRLGVILIQLPASFERTDENTRRVLRFLDRLPGNLRFGIEFRHPGWFVEPVFDQLNARGMPLALVAGKWIPEKIMLEAFDRVASPFAYIRFMGIRDLPKFDRVYRRRTDVLELWAERIKKLSADEVFIYVDNYFEGHAPATANKLIELLGMTPTDPAELEEQPSLF